MPQREDWVVGHAARADRIIAGDREIDALFAKHPATDRHPDLIGPTKAFIEAIVKQVPHPKAHVHVVASGHHAGGTGGYGGYIISVTVEPPKPE